MRACLDRSGAHTNLMTVPSSSGPRNLRFRFHQDPSSSGVGPSISSHFIQDPLAGQFTVDADKEVIKPILVKIANRYAEYAASGSDEW